jgi:prepilin-type N-terminal cleavage/methylation domain-containing protein
MTARSSQGFSAVELMVGITVLGILMLGFMAVFPLAGRSVSKGEDLSIASGLAQDQLERLKSLPAGEPDLVAGDHDSVDNPIRGRFNLSWTVTDDTPLPGMKMIDMTVSYLDGGRNRNVRYSTYFRAP